MNQTPTKLISSESRFIIAGDDIPFGAYQAIYHHITKKAEKREKTYRGAYTISFLDIQNLYQRFVQATKQYSIKSSRCQITHALRDDTSMEHSSFEKFKLSDLSTRSCTSSLNFEFDFLIVLPPEVPEASEIAQRFTVNLLLDQDYIENNNYDAPVFMRGFFYRRNIMLRIEFSDYSVSQTLQATVDSWVDSLELRPTNSASRILFQIEKPAKLYLAQMVKAITLIAAAWSARSVTDIKSGVILVILSICASQLLATLSDGMVDRFYKELDNVKPMTYLILTEGDKAKRNNEQIRIRKATALIYFLAVGVFGSILIGIFSNFVYESLKHSIL